MLPVNFLIYSVAYPLKYTGSRINISKNGIGFNLRIYSLSIGAETYKTSIVPVNKPTLIRNLGWYDYDMWREIHYYEYVKDQIINRNISPNFITYFCMVRINYQK